MPAATSGFQRAAAWVADARIGSGGAAHRGGRASGYVDHGHHAGFRLDWFRRVGGYDASFSHNEDAELDHRIALAGGRVWLDAGIRVAYSVRPTLAALARQYWTYGRGRARTVRKHRMRPRLRQMLPPLLVAALLLGLPLAPATPLALLPAAAYAAAVAMVSLVALVRMRSFCGLWAGPAMAAMHLAWGAGFLVETGFGATPAPARRPGRHGDGLAPPGRPKTRRADRQRVNLRNSGLRFSRKAAAPSLLSSVS